MTGLGDTGDTWCRWWRCWCYWGGEMGWPMWCQLRHCVWWAVPVWAGSVSHSHTEPGQLRALDTLQIYVRHGQFGQLLSHLNIVQPGDNNLYVWKNILCKLNEQFISGQSAHLWFMSVSCSKEIWFLYRMSFAKLEPRQLSVYSPTRDRSPSEFLQKVR